MVNTGRETDFAKSVALELIGAEQVDLERPVAMGSEDFAYMLEKARLLSLHRQRLHWIKGGNTIHNPNYDFNDDNVAIGCAYWYLLAKRYLVPL